jgi:hypothetical protein
MHALETARLAADRCNNASLAGAAPADCWGYGVIRAKKGERHGQIEQGLILNVEFEDAPQEKGK